MADWSSGGSRRCGGSRSHLRQPSVEYGDWKEEDTWSAAKDRGGRGGGGAGGDYSRRSAASRMIPRTNLSTDESRTPHVSSAPVSIPDWSRIYGKSKKEGEGEGIDSSSGSRMWTNYGWDEESEVQEDEEYEDGEIVPPHEWIARKLARSQISSSSMCEGIGRTLKGRDLSKVRNSVLSKTGFLE